MRRRRVFRSITGIVSFLLLASMPIQADPVTMSHVIQIIGQNSTALRYRSFPQESTSKPGATTSILAGVAVSSDESPSSVHTVSHGDVEATICDCGEILVAGGGFPKWPLLFLTAIPLFLPHHDDQPDIPISLPPTLTPPGGNTAPESPVPEPASLLLFGSGLVALGAVLRRRYAGMKLAAHVNVAEESPRHET